MRVVVFYVVPVAMVVALIVQAWWMTGPGLDRRIARQKAEKAASEAAWLANAERWNRPTR